MTHDEYIWSYADEFTNNPLMGEEEEKENEFDFELEHLRKAIDELEFALTNDLERKHTEFYNDLDDALALMTRVEMNL